MRSVAIKSSWLLAFITLPPTAFALVDIDFSNNLASDLGPLLALFGENVTKQYLRESCSYVDYIIFSIAPIGIITTISAVIRVCGSPKLRGFIGRAQEGFGQVEAELMSSTSRDLCELFNHGAITRVLGRPRILEVLHGRRYTTDKLHYQPQDETTPVANPGRIYVFRDILKTTNSLVTARRHRRLTDTEREKLFNDFPHPNLTLNVGIRKAPTVVRFSIVVLGLAVQAAILTVSGIGASGRRQILGLQSIAEGDEAPVNLLQLDDSARTFISGTVFMSIGVFLCAVLIGESTQESLFPRHKSKIWSTPDDAEDFINDRLYWLQPGGQVVGDQTFGACAYTERDEDKENGYTISQRVQRGRQYEFFTIVAVIITIGGYACQFIGLRGLGPWISIGQLAGTFLMSIVRALLKTRKFGQNRNGVKDLLDVIPGHELDWFALEILMPRKSLEAFQAQKERAFSPPKVLKSKVGAAQWFIGGACVSPIYAHDTISRASRLDIAQQALCYRQQLAFHTGNVDIMSTVPPDPDHVPWEDRFVKVRAKSRDLTEAIRRTRKVLRQGNALRSPPRQIFLPIVLKGAKTSRRTLVLDEDQLEDSELVEAVLGLWVWSYYARGVDQRDTGSQGSAPRWLTPSTQTQMFIDGMQVGRILCVTPASKDFRVMQYYTLSQLELYNSAHQSEYSVLYGNVDSNSFLKSDSMALWDFGERDVFADGRPVTDIPHLVNDGLVSREQPYYCNLMRFFGWNMVQTHEACIKLHETQPGTLDNESRESEPQSQCASDLEQVNVVYSMPDRRRVDRPSSEPDARSSSLLTECGIELFAFVLRGLLHDNDIGSVQPHGAGFRNESLDAVRSIFIDPSARVGDHDDAMLCLMPLFRQHLFEAELSPTLFYAVAGSFLHEPLCYLWHLHESVIRAPLTSDTFGMKKDTIDRRFVTSLYVTGEMYRVALGDALFEAKTSVVKSSSRSTFRDPVLPSKPDGHGRNGWLTTISLSQLLDLFDAQTLDVPARADAYKPILARYIAVLHRLLEDFKPYRMYNISSPEKTRVVASSSESLEYGNLLATSIAELELHITEHSWRNECTECVSFHAFIQEWIESSSLPEPPLQDQQMEFCYSIFLNRRSGALYTLTFLRKTSFDQRVMRSMLPEAARRGWTEIVKTLLLLGVPIDSEDLDEATAFVRAAELNSDIGKELCAYLLELGASTRGLWTSVQDKTEAQTKQQPPGSREPVTDESPPEIQKKHRIALGPRIGVYNPEDWVFPGEP